MGGEVSDQGTVKSLRIGKPDAAKYLEKDKGSTTIMGKSEERNLRFFHILQGVKIRK
nr:MAG TPA: hypothetical protein [Caudoviricetes sp.]